MNALTAKAVQDTTRHQQASRHEKHWQHAYGSLQSNRQPATKLGTGADAFAEVVLQAQSMAKQNKMQALQQQGAGQVTLAVDQKKGFQPGIAPTTRGSETRLLQHRLPTEGQASSLHVPSAKPAWAVDDEPEAKGKEGKGGKEGSKEGKESKGGKNSPRKQGGQNDIAKQLDGKLQRGASSVAVHKTKSRTCVVS